MKLLSLATLTPLTILAAFVGCSAGEESPSKTSTGSGQPPTAAASTGVGGSPATSSTTVASSSANTGGTMLAGSSSAGPGGGGTGGSDVCAGQSQQAKEAPLDMVIMLDSSGSMVGERWNAVTTALSSFFNDPSAADLGAGLQYFPVYDPGQCTDNAQCSTGACNVGVCSEDVNKGCATDGDCTERCLKGYCEATTPFYVPCNDEIDCFFSGACISFDGGLCDGATLQCNEFAYSSLDVPIAPLGMNKTALFNSMQNHFPTGLTPTAPALKGAIVSAKQYAIDNPGHKVVAVLASDGLPEGCAPEDLGAIAQNGLGGTPSVPTFVIGIGVDAETQATLDDVAAKGGTGQAIIIDTSAPNVSLAFQDALDAVRESSLDCEYIIPESQPGQMPDFNKVNVDYTPAQGQKQTIPYVTSPSQCDPTNGGWYYDVDPSQADPSLIKMCDATCDLFKSGGGVDIRIGCETAIAK